MLNPAQLANDISSQWGSFTGSNKPATCNALGLMVNAIIGKSFTTMDVGLVPGSGVGVGAGLFGLNAAAMANQAKAQMMGSWGGYQGVNLDTFVNGIFTALVSHLQLAASLNSTHTPVFQGTGTIIAGTISVPQSEVSNYVKNGAPFIGVNWQPICDAVGAAVQTGMLSATGTVIITGSPSGIPSPGGGTGFGVIT